MILLLILLRILIKIKEVDAIVNDEGIARFYAVDCIDKIKITKESREMTPKLRQAASNFVRAQNKYYSSLNEYAKDEYNEWEDLEISNNASDYFKKMSGLKYIVTGLIYDFDTE